MSSRDAILKAIRQHPLEPTELPTFGENWIQFEDPHAQFAKVLELVGGRCIRVKTRDDVNRELAALPAFSGAKVRYSSVGDVGMSCLDPASVTDPHELESVDFAVLRGELAVAENAAVWITDEKMPHRVVYFIAQHLALVVPAKRVVHHLGEAYRAINIGQRHFGAFISGPSKTADIEQSLVIGAHGPRSHLVFLVDQEEF